MGDRPMKIISRLPLSGGAVIVPRDHLQSTPAARVRAGCGMVEKAVRYVRIDSDEGAYAVPAMLLDSKSHILHCSVSMVQSLAQARPPNRLQSSTSAWG